MKTLKHIALAGVGMLGATAWAEEAKPPVPAPVASESAAADKSAAKQANEVRVQYDHQVDRRIFTAYYSNLSQARLVIRAVNQYDAALAKPRIYYIAELSGAGLSDRIVFDVEDDAARVALLGVLERFKSESVKTTELVKRMEARKAQSEKELSTAETKLVQLKDTQGSAPELIVKTEAEIEKLKDAIAVADELSKMKKITGDMGSARIHPDRPAYSFEGTFEPGTKQLYILRAGFGVQISHQNVDYYIDLLKRAPELKQRMLDGEAKEKRLRGEIKALFKQD